MAIVEPNTNSQKPKAFRRGNATSGDPICSGRTKLAKPITMGVAYIRSITVPCIVKSWLNCSVDRNCMPGRASSARMSSAIKPPIRKNAKQAVMYIMPINL
ncbi:Uncharacterised protein [Mycobacteroides abscessus subsp. abscessus]|nr:Uncharacterised protein [Mycobacteroides abscessus subsp. abscessus]